MKKLPEFGNVTAVILAGGENSRMGGVDKGMLPVKNLPMIQYIAKQLESYFGEIIIGGKAGSYSFLGYRIIPDVSEKMGPLMGIYSCLLASASDLNFITACDIPDIRIGLVREMIRLSTESDIVVPVSADNNYEPLHGIYRKSVIPVAAELLKEKRLRLSDLFVKMKTIYVPFDGRGWYYNINTPADYSNYGKNPEGQA
ncbi:MAG: molybdenum cofactor guanylyltransferase [Bacteroidales bacterium]|nr:molybdenum cofactor guanylyltransferase [Bacteroidales bacterium]